MGNLNTIYPETPKYWKAIHIRPSAKSLRNLINFERSVLNSARYQRMRAPVRSMNSNVKT